MRRSVHAASTQAGPWPLTAGPWWAALILLGISACLAGCGRPTLPGGIKGPRAVTSIAQSKSSAAPNLQKPSWEAGPKTAKVRILAFFPIDPEHQELQDLLRSLVKQYPGKVYVKYTDYRTAAGQQAMQLAGNTGLGLLVNGQSTIDIKKARNPYTANLSGEMGRYWTADYLKDAVAQEVAKAYGKA